MDAISRFEKILRGDPIDPVSRLEIFAAMAAGTWTGDPLTPVTRLEYFLSQISGGGGGGETKSTLINKPAFFTGTLHYTGSLSEQQITAPEGIVYDKVWTTDEIISLVSTHCEYYINNTASTVHAYEVGRIQAKSLYFRWATKIQANGLAYLTSLTALILPSASVVTLENVNAFSNTPFASGGSGGTLYVPSSLISSYQSASNWSTILGYANNSIQAIEGSIYE